MIMLKKKNSYRNVFNRVAKNSFLTPYPIFRIFWLCKKRKKEEEEKKKKKKKKNTPLKITHLKELCKILSQFDIIILGVLYMYFVL